MCVSKSTLSFEYVLRLCLKCEGSSQRVAFNALKQLRSGNKECSLAVCRNPHERLQTKVARPNSIITGRNLEQGQGLRNPSPDCCWEDKKKRETRAHKCSMHWQSTIIAICPSCFMEYLYWGSEWKRINLFDGEQVEYSEPSSAFQQAITCYSLL